MNNAIRLTMPILAAGLLASCGPSPKERFERAQQAFAEHRYDAARLDYTSVLREDSTNLEAMDGLVRTFLALENPIAAKGMLDRMARRGGLPDDAPVLYGEAALLATRYDEALQRVKGVNSAGAYRVKALAHLRRGETEEAGQAFMAGQSAPGPKAKLLASYAQYMIAQGEPARAAELAAMAAKAEPFAHDVMIANAEVAMANNRQKDALDWYDRCIKRYPESRAALLGKIAALGSLGQTKKIRPLLDDGLRRFGGDPDFVYFNALLAAENKEWSKVRAILQPLESVLDGLPMANTLYARAMLEMGHAEQARIRLTSQLLRDPDNRNARLLLARAQMALGEPAEAVETLSPLAALSDVTEEERALMAEVWAAASGA